jgi:hypothetical protein
MDLGHFKPFEKKRPKVEKIESLEAKYTPMNKRSLNVDILPPSDNDGLKSAENSLDQTAYDIDQTPLARIETEQIGKNTFPEPSLLTRNLNMDS